MFLYIKDIYYLINQYFDQKTIFYLFYKGLKKESIFKIKRKSKTK